MTTKRTDSPCQPGLRPAGNIGFTLIELLIVMVIIFILVSILMPAIGRSKELAKRVTCLSGMRQWHIGYELWANDNDQFYPGIVSLEFLNGWTSMIGMQSYTYPTWAQKLTQAISDDVLADGDLRFCASLENTLHRDRSGTTWPLNGGIPWSTTDYFILAGHHSWGDKNSPTPEWSGYYGWHATGFEPWGTWSSMQPRIDEGRPPMVRRNLNSSNNQLMIADRALVPGFENDPTASMNGWTKYRWYRWPDYPSMKPNPGLISNHTDSSGRYASGVNVMLSDGRGHWSNIDGDAFTYYRSYYNDVQVGRDLATP
jgi:hypothetical protein